MCFPIPAADRGGPSYELPADQRTGAVREIFVLSHSHLDIGFTRPPDEVPRDYKDTIDTAIRLTREYPDYRWTIESAWMLEEWLRRTDDAELVRELGDMLREGRMGLGVAFGNMHSGLMAAEESNRLVYLGHKLRRRFGIEAPVAFQNDVPGFTWAFPRVLQGSGVRYLVTGLNLFIGGGNSLGLGKQSLLLDRPGRQPSSHVVHLRRVHGGLPLGSWAGISSGAPRPDGGPGAWPGSNGTATSTTRIC